jgi:hypothetical protein
MKMKTTTLMLSFAAILFVALEAGCQEQQKAAPAAQPAVLSATNAAPAAPAAPEAKPVEKKETVKATKKIQTGPVIAFDTLERDLGAVGPGTKHTVSYAFRNTGNETLKIDRVESTCNCTVPALDKKEYAPGEEGKIEATYTAVASTSPVTKHISVFCNDKTKTNSEVQLTIKAVSVPKVQITPATFQLSLIEANGGMPELTLKATDGTPFSITSIGSTGDSITADFDPNAKATTYTLKAKVDMKKLAIANNGILTIALTHPECSAVEARYLAKPEYETQPAIFYMSGVEIDRKETKPLWIVSNYDKDFEIESITSEKGSMKIASQEKQGKKYYIMVDVTPTAAAAQAKFFRDTLNIKIKDGPTLKVACNMWFKQPAAEVSK